MPDKKMLKPAIRLPDRCCLACGTTKNMARKFYCSSYCRQRLAHSLDLRVGLLQALGVRFATFYFSDTTITIDVLLYGEENILRFDYPRTIGCKPSNDFSLMADLLGAAWWTELDKTKKRFMANERVIGLGTPCDDAATTIRPISISVPSIKSEFLNAMGITKKDLQVTNITEVIRNTYRAEIKRRHPDVGGSPEDFRNLHRAYKEIKDWLTSPNYTTKMGFSNKWFYSGASCRWIPPQPRINF